MILDVPQFALPSLTDGSSCANDGTDQFTRAYYIYGGKSLLIPDFKADKPFVFLIRDCKTGTILFLGRVEDPRSGEL